MSKPEAINGSLNWVEVDLDAIAFNVAAFKRHVGNGVEVFAVVKGNAYGHGAVQVSRTALQSGATRLAVHRVEEGIELRKAGINAPILVMGYTPVNGIEPILRWDLTPSMMTIEFAHALSQQAAAAGKIVPVHVKVDTGMARFGLMPPEVVDFVLALQQLPGVVVEGLFTHFATSDAFDLTHLRRQLDVFNDVRSAVSGRGVHIPLAHAANSAAVMRLPESHLNAVRPGISLYGLLPSDQWPPVFEIKPALTLKGILCRVRDVPAGTGISYGRSFVTDKETRIGLVPVGYGDGYHRILSGRGGVLVGGVRAPILGRICMDQFVVDLTGVPNAALEDEVVVIGSQGAETIPAEEVAMHAGTINYEVTTAILPRVTRIYLQSGKVVGVVKLAED